MEDTIVIGAGEVGRAIIDLEEEAGHTLYILDKKYDEDPPKQRFKVMHVCIPYTEKFVNDVNLYMDEYPSSLVMVHSTLPVGTMEKLDKNTALVHSPVRGKHPNLSVSLLKFIKYIGGSEEDCSFAKTYFKELGIKSVRIGDFKASELAKLLDTTYYGWCIAFADRVNELCKQHGVDYNLVYKDWNETYNDGYKRLALTNVVRPVLDPPQGGIGGHCVWENAVLLDDKILSEPILRIGKKKDGGH